MLAGELRRELAATFFFPKTGICKSRRIFLTIAHQLAVRYPPYRSYLDDCMRMDPAFFDKTSETLIQTLFITPTFCNMFPINPDHRHVIIIDGLGSQGSEQEQSKFLGLVCQFVLDHPTSPFVWIISSRPEEHLCAKFSEIERLHICYKEVELDPNSEQAREDVKKFLRDEFRRIQHRFPDATPSGPWPTSNQLLKVASSSSGFFPFASAILHFVGQSTLGGPVSRLNHVLTLLDNPESTAVFPVGDLFRPLDSLYSPIMSEIPVTELPAIRSLLGFCMSHSLVPAHESVPFQLACNILNIKRHIAYSALQSLRSSILSLPPPSNAHNVRLQFVHGSFPDYLRNPQRSSPHTISMDYTLAELWRCHTRIVSQWLPSRCESCPELKGRPFTKRILATDGIKIFWAPEIQSQTARELKEKMFEKASSCWPIILHRYCHQWCSNSCQQKSQSQALLDVPSFEVIEFLKQIDFGCPALFGKDPVHMLNVLR
ncbi:hypothetical protein P691DRAFT_734101 [Macrolepiota fuliginosa MF-IS2]|uniref:NACHT domain-containing protein n=1 Tax=Macrolepiota fuliginosa MF-IS2 TaxID=1400762 RepID=A0A9P5XAA9_9AGAR|nr:hypothetical protein P691DRAFT_734101 [Macrolepiota fuliginosa MF-IS2]